MTGGAHAHELPPHALTTLPPLTGAVKLSQALAASWDRCIPCLDRDRDAVKGTVGDVHQAFALFLMWCAISLHALRLTPGGTAESVAAQVMKTPAERLRGPLLSLLADIPVETIAGPDGRPAANWNPDLVAGLLFGLDDYERGQVWDECLLFLTAVLAESARRGGR
ncbi:hypothetical protein AB0M39_41800 [Streptomyces sp. NPDC051907]|uniref:hypothetical protein n=1 Tax=Streptomyces sp. NPDC051907 TaxID=3155284 RepID=UPI0034214517